jgi:hypothetical protein
MGTDKTIFEEDPEDLTIAHPWPEVMEVIACACADFPRVLFFLTKVVVQNVGTRDWAVFWPEMTLPVGLKKITGKKYGKMFYNVVY